jgi:hypothetical protein
MSAVLLALSNTAMTLAGISWRPEIRGILTVAVSVVLLCGSVYLLLGTNLGSRLGFLVAFAAFWGWMVMLGIVWWMYAKGPSQSDQVRAAQWEVVDVVDGDLSAATIDEAAEDPDLSEWDELDPANPDRGEAQAVVDEFMTQGDQARFEATTDYVTIDGFSTGGKPPREGDSMWDRVTWTVTDTLRLTHPTHYAVLQIRPSVEQIAVPGQPPPSPTADPTEPVINVIMVRDLGNVRVRPAATTLFSLLVFAIACNQLHRRDKLAHQHEEEAKAAAAG